MKTTTMLDIDLLYVAWNRLEFTVPSFDSVIDNTNWELVRRCYIHDDGSTDMTFEHLQQQIKRIPVPVELTHERLGGPVAAMQAYLDRRNCADDCAEFFAKVDNDFVMPPQWLDVLAETIASSGVDILGTEPFIGLDAHAPGWPAGYGYTTASHIGGKGLIRASAFEGRPLRPRGRFGFTEWQHEHEDVIKAWVTPDIKSFGLDQLPFEPWASLTKKYVRLGWQREWPKYAWASADYWSWWQGTREATPA